MDVWYLSERMEKCRDQRTVRIGTSQYGYQERLIKMVWTCWM